MNKRNFIILILALFLVISVLNIDVNKVFALENSDEYTAKSLYLIDYNTGTVLYEKDSEVQLPVASIVKLMTIEITCEEIESGRLSIDQVVTASANSASMGGSQVFIEEGGEYTVGDLLKSTIVSSANDASVALAETICGSEENFVSLMNKKASELGLKNTNYVNCTGLPAIGQFSCAKDTANLLKKVSSHDIYHKYSTIWMDTLKHPKGRESELVNTNKLIRYFEGCDGGKTGSTSEAGYCLSATAKRGNMRLIGVVLGAENGKKRFAETSKLLNYGFSNYENKKVVDKNNEKNIFNMPVSGGKGKSVQVCPKEDLYMLVKKREDIGNITTKIELNEGILAPISKGAVVGKIYVINNGVVQEECDMIAMHDVEKATFTDSINDIINVWQIAG